MKYFSENAKYINAECESCRKVSKIRREICFPVDNGYTLKPAARCVCGNVSNSIFGRPSVTPIFLDEKESVETPKENKEVSKTVPPKNNNLLIVLIVLIVACGCWGLLPKDNSNNSNRTIMASIQCRDFVRDRLKSPSTASFPMSEGTDIGNNTYTVYSYVDAENSFGAKIRNNFYCKLRYTGGDDGYRSNWSLLEINID